MALIHVLDKQKDIIIATLNSEKGEYLDAVMTSSLDNKNVFDFVALQKFDKLEKRNRLLVEDVDGFFSEYIISYTDQYKRNEKIVRSDASFIDLKKAKVIEPQALVGQTPSTAVEFALIGTEWQVGDVDFANIRTITIADFTDPYTFLKLIASTFDLELRFRVSVQGNKIVGRYVDLKKDNGKFEGKEITFGKDLIGVKRIEDSSRIVTALLGVGPEREDGSRLTILVENQEALQRWGRKGKHLIELYEPQSDDQDMTESRLRTLTENELEKRIDAAVSYECEAVAMEHVFGKSHERIRLGHTVRIKDDGYTPPLYVEARIKEIEVDPATRKVLKFKIGNFIEYKKEDLEKQVKLLKQIMSDRLSALIIPSITSSAGNIFKNGIGITELTANAFLSGLEYDADGTKYTYTWSKHDKTGNLVPSFVKAGKTITVTASEIDEKATYVVTVKNDKVSIPAEITISNVFDGADGKDGYTPIKGVDYFDGVDGQNGKDGSSSFLWVRYSQNADGSNMTTDPTGAKYIGVATSKTSTAPTSNADYQWSLVKGTDGVKGEKGADGQTSYLHIKYSNDGGKTFTANNGETVGDWIGTYVDFTELDSTNVTDYTWNKVKGEQGPQGIQGPKGADGQTLYTWIKYANDANGTGMSDYPDGKSYIGLAYNKTVKTESTNPADYTWALIEGPQGVKGTDGKTYYTWLKYADSPTSGMSDSPTGKKYMGIAYNKTTSTESTNYADYSWSLIQGPQGPQGVQGPKGADGQSLYTWVKYADSPTSGMSDYPTNKKYIGLAYNKTTPVESTNYADYQWAKIEGDQGAPGAPGTTTYTWVKYADDDKGAGMSDSPVGKRYLGLAYNKTTATESTNPADYSWSPLYDNVQVGGVNLLDKTALTNGHRIVGGSTNENYYEVYDEPLSPSGKALKIKVIKSTTGLPGRYWRLDKRLEVGKTYTWSFYAKGNGSWLIGSEQNGQKVIQPTADFKKYTYTFVAKDTVYYMFTFYENTPIAGTTSELNFYSLNLVRGNIDVDWSPSIADVEADAQAKANKAEQNANTYTNTVKTQLQKDITDVNNSVLALDTYVDGAFKDGIISNAEATAIEKYLNTVNAEKTDLDGRYLQIYNNTDLTNATIKTDLYNKKVAYNSAHTNLINAINTAIADGKTTLAEKQDVDSKFASYRTALANLTTVFEKALTSISQKQADTAKTTAIDTASTDATNKANSALSSANTYTNNKDTALRDGLNTGAVAVNATGVHGMLAAGKLDIDLAIQTGIPEPNLYPLVDYIDGNSVTVETGYTTFMYWTFKHSKRYITFRIAGRWAGERNGQDGMGLITGGRCDYAVATRPYAENIIPGSQGSFSNESPLFNGNSYEQARDITVDTGTPNNGLKFIYLLFKGNLKDTTNNNYVHAFLRCVYVAQHD